MKVPSLRPANTPKSINLKGRNFVYYGSRSGAPHFRKLTKEDLIPQSEKKPKLNFLINFGENIKKFFPRRFLRK